MPINKVNTMKLVRALESGKYMQCTNQLKRRNKFCCLGVATDLFIKEKPEEGAWGGEFIEEQGDLHESVRKWLGWKDHNGQQFVRHLKDNDGNTTNLAVLNDGENIEPRNFKKIAKLIRKYLAALKQKRNR